MKHPFFIVAFLFILALGIAGKQPVFIHAQTISSSSTSTFRERSQQWNGNPGTQLYQWRTSSNLVSSQISLLSTQAPVSIPIPILFGVSLSDLTPNFGDPRPGGPHEGLDILAPKGTPIVSPTQAVVLSAGVYIGGGNYVSTANAGGENFVYMHLDRPAVLTVGAMLQPGDLIGYVGNTGDASSGPAHVHFEIRKDGVATDPFPRLKQEFSLTQKIGFLQIILAGSPVRDELVKFLVATYADQFVAARIAGIALPQDIATELQRVSSGGLGIYTGRDLYAGMSGKAVVALQNFLIFQNKGPASRALSAAGATGNFGPVTKAALIEYQTALGIVPADGYYGLVTRVYVENAGPPPSPGAGTGTGANSSTTLSTSTSVPIHDLQVVSRSTEVTWLQNFLITANNGLAARSLAVAGATGYFGPITRAALAEYQSKAGIAPAVGYFGPLTRAYLMALLRAK